MSTAKKLKIAMGASGLSLIVTTFVLRPGSPSAIFVAFAGVLLTVALGAACWGYLSYGVSPRSQKLAHIWLEASAIAFLVGCGFLAAAFAIFGLK